MQDFARLTIYNKRLSVTKIEEVAAYPLENLFSDIGEHQPPALYYVITVIESVSLCVCLFI